MRRIRRLLERALALLRSPHTRTALFTVAGATLGLLLAARVGASVGPFDCTVVARPSTDSATVIRLAPLGSIELDTHAAPVRIELRVDELRPEEAQRFVADPELLEGVESAGVLVPATAAGAGGTGARDRGPPPPRPVRLTPRPGVGPVEDELAADARGALEALALRALLASVLGGAIGALAARATAWHAVSGAIGGLVLAGSVAAATVATFRPEAVSEPRYTGLLTIAPRAVADVEDLVERFDDYRAQLTGLVGNVVTLYQAAEDLPGLDPGDDAVRVLHVSDIHNNPQGFDLAEALVRQFDIDVVVDTGDITDWGTAPEARLFGSIEDLGVPYVWVRGNHDSRATQRQVAAQQGAIVLDGDAVDVAGLRIWGIGDPRFTPDQSTDSAQEAQAADVANFARDVERSLREANPAGIDLVAIHDARSAAGIGGLVPLILSGHSHEPREDAMGESLLLVEGSTGGTGLRALQGDDPEPLTASVLYFAAADDRLVAYDRITVESFGGAAASIQRHVVEEQDGPDAGAGAGAGATGPR